MYESVGDDSLREQEAYRRILTRDPDSLRFAEYADLLRRLGQLDEAIEVCSSGLARNPHYSTGHVVMGEVLQEAGQLAEAEAEWQLALQLDPGHPRAHLRLGDLYLARADKQRAATAFEAALLYCPDFAEARSRLAEARGERPAARTSTAVAQPARRPRERPVWLTEDRFGELLETLRRCASVKSVALTDTAGTPLATDEITPAHAAVKPAASFVNESRDLLSRLAAGRLRAALIVGAKASVRCVPLGDLNLVVGLKKGMMYHEFDQQLEEVLSGPCEQVEENEHG